MRAQFPGCPPDEAARIAEGTCEKDAGRVGRSAAAKALDPAALGLAVITRIRHAHPAGDERLMRHGDRRQARQEGAADIDWVLAKWSGR